MSYLTEQFSWVPLPYCSPPGCPFPIKSLALSVHVSPRTIHFRVLDKSPVSGPGRGPPSCNRSILKVVKGCTDFVIVFQSLSHVQFFATPWTAASQASLSFTISWNLLRLPTPVSLPGKIPWTEEPGGMQSTGSQRVGHN